MSSRCAPLAALSAARLAFVSVLEAVMAVDRPSACAWVLPVAAGSYGWASPTRKTQTACRSPQTSEWLGGGIRRHRRPIRPAGVARVPVHTRRRRLSLPAGALLLRARDRSDSGDGAPVTFPGVASLPPHLRPFRGLREDWRRRAPWYWRDWADGFTTKSVAASLFLYFACLAPIVAFGGLTAQITNGAMGVVEFMVSGAVSGMLYHTLAGQPLTIVGPTGLTLAFTASLYKVCSVARLPFLATYAWVGVWTALFLLLLAIFNASFLIRYCTRFTDDAFNALIAATFLYEAVKSIGRSFQTEGADKTAAFFGLALPAAVGARVSVGFRCRHRHLLHDAGGAAAAATERGAGVAAAASAQHVATGRRPAVAGADAERTAQHSSVRALPGGAADGALLPGSEHHHPGGEFAGAPSETRRRLPHRSVGVVGADVFGVHLRVAVDGPGAARAHGGGGGESTHRFRHPSGAGAVAGILAAAATHSGGGHQRAVPVHGPSHDERQRFPTAHSVVLCGSGAVPGRLADAPHSSAHRERVHRAAAGVLCVAVDAESDTADHALLPGGDRDADGGAADGGAAVVQARGDPGAGRRDRGGAPVTRG
eukprot:ctg_381.g132